MENILSHLYLQGNKTLAKLAKMCENAILKYRKYFVSGGIKKLHWSHIDKAI